MTPRILIVDDLFGRILPAQVNAEREALCGKYLLQDISDDSPGVVRTSRIKRPVARAVFHRGQSPLCGKIGDRVENDLNSVIRMVRTNWVDLEDEREAWALVLLDLSFKTGKITAKSDAGTPGLPEGRASDNDPNQYFGLRILEELHLTFPELPVVILSSKGEDDVKEKYTELGARSFLDKSSGSPEELERLIREEGLIPDDTGLAVGFSRPFLIALREARNSALGGENVHIHGERGSGKELLAEYIHQHTPGMADRPFVTVDCGTLSPELYAAALFGQTKGAFTGAAEAKQGRIAEANGGDLFLDEIGNMPAGVQDGLLRVTEQKLVTRVGGKPEPVDVRFISATNLDLEAAAARGTFRDDLLDRLRKGGVIHLPALRERIDDVSYLVQLFVRQAEAAFNARSRKIKPEVLASLADYEWPGNVRELRSCIFQAVRNNRRLPVLIPEHLRLPRGVQITVGDVDRLSDVDSNPQLRGESTLTESRPIRSYASATPSKTVMFADLCASIDCFDVFALHDQGLCGHYRLINNAHARLLVRYLKACLEVTKQKTPRKPEGEIVVQRAVRLLTGDEKLKTSEAYDIIKRIVRLAPAAVSDLLADPDLKEAYDMASRGRPTRSTT